MIYRYYKRFDIPDLKRLGKKIEDSQITWKYQNNTLLIAYNKPPEVLESDIQKKKDFRESDSKGGGQPEEGAVDCKQQ